MSIDLPLTINIVGLFWREGIATLSMTKVIRVSQVWTLTSHLDLQSMY